MPIWLGPYLAVVSLLLCAGLIPLAMRLARRLGVMDHPSPRKIHRASTPLLGGLAIFAAFTLTTWGHLLAGYLLRAHEGIAGLVPPVMFQMLGTLETHWLRLSVVMLGGILIFVVGLLDDVRGLSVRKRLIAEFAISTVVVALGIRPELDFVPDWLLWCVSIVWIVGITNSFNLLDGADGLAAGVAIISSVFLGCVMWIGQQPMVAMFLFALAGSVGGFFLYNRHPARIFMGSAGSMWMGYHLAVTVLAATRVSASGNWIVPVAIPLLVLGIPIYDTLSVILIRVIRRQPITLADKNHLHHRLMRIGFSQRQAVYFIHLFAFCIGVNSLLLVRTNLVGGVILSVQILALFGILVIAERVSMRIARIREEGRRRSRALDGPLPFVAPGAVDQDGAVPPGGVPSSWPPDVRQEEAPFRAE